MKVNCVSHLYNAREMGKKGEGEGQEFIAIALYSRGEGIKERFHSEEQF